MNPREVIDDNIEGLVESIEVKNTTLWEKLIELKLFKASDVDYIKVSFITVIIKFLIEITLWLYIHLN